MTHTSSKVAEWESSCWGLSTNPDGKQTDQKAHKIGKQMSCICHDSQASCQIATNHFYNLQC